MKIMKISTFLHIYPQGCAPGSVKVHGAKGWGRTYTCCCMIPQKFPVVKIKMWSFPRIGGKFPVFVPRMGLTNRFFS